MSDNERPTWQILRDTWMAYVLQIAMTIPQDGIAELEGRERRKRRSGTWPLWALVGVLAIASITNLSDRAYTHKAGFSANMVGMGLALMVPVVVHFAIKSTDKWKWGIWTAGVTFASFSGIIQYQIYAPDGGFVFDKDHLEALVFGAGVPLAECILAGIAAIVVMQEQRQEEELKSDTLAAQDELDRKAAEAAERKTQMEYELEQRRLDAEARRENERIKAQAVADAKRIKAQGQSVHPTVQGGVQNEQSTSENKQSVDDQLDNILNMLRGGEKSPTKNARALGVSRGTYYNRLNDLESAGLIHRNGNGVEVV